MTPYSETVWYQDFWGGWQSATASVDANGNIRTTGFSRGAKIDTVLRNLRYPGNMCNQTAYAIWEKAPGFTISFNVNGGSINISNQVALDITLPNPGTRPGYTFDGWYNGDKKIGGMGDKWKPTADTTITAKWNVITYHISYVLYEGTLNGSNPITYTVESLNEKLNETFLGVYYENPLKRSFFMGLNNQDFTCFREFLHTGFLKMRELNRRITTFLKKLTRPICITILWIWGVKFRSFQNYPI